MQLGLINAQRAMGQGGAAPAPRLVRAAHEFEGQMMKELLKPMTDESLLTDDAESSGSGTVLGEFGAEALGQALSRKGGFGIAHRILGELSRSGNSSADGKVTANLHGDTRMRTSE